MSNKKSAGPAFEDIIAYEQGELDEDAHLKMFQEAVDSGLAWSLQGSYGREAMSLIEAGQIALGPTAHTDYYGNRVPSRTEVKSGTKGSVEFVKAHGGRVPGAS